MKKIVKYFSLVFAVVLLAFSAVLFTGCGDKDAGNINVDLDAKQRAIYNSAVASGYEGTYEEWLASIKGKDGKDATYATYTVKFNYAGAEDCFKTVKQSAEVKSTEWILEVPEVKDEYKECFDGWFIDGTDVQIANYAFIGGNVTLCARFNNLRAGLYTGENFISWAELKTQYPNRFTGNTIVGSKADDSVLEDETSFQKTFKGRLVLDKEVETIGEYAFNNCVYLTEIVIPNSVKTIGEHAFEKCLGLVSVTVPSSVTAVAPTAFNDCIRMVELYNLTALVINVEYPSLSTAVATAKNVNVYYSQNVQSKLVVSNDVIYYVDGAEKIAVRPLNLDCKNIAIDKNCTKIGEGAFAICDELISVNIPDGIKSINEMAFGKCIKLSNVVLPNSLTHLGVGAFIQCKALTSIVIPESVTTIGQDAFSFCFGLKTAHIGSGVTTNDRIFGSCNALEKVYIDSENVAKNLSKNEPYGYIFGEAVSNIYIKSGLETSTDESWVNKFTKQATSDVEGYDLWVKVSA